MEVFLSTLSTLSTFSAFILPSDLHWILVTHFHSSLPIFQNRETNSQVLTSAAQILQLDTRSQRDLITPTSSQKSNYIFLILRISLTIRGHSLNALSNAMLFTGELLGTDYVIKAESTWVGLIPLWKMPLGTSFPFLLPCEHTSLRQRRLFPDFNSVKFCFGTCQPVELWAINLSFINYHACDILLQWPKQTSFKLSSQMYHPVMSWLPWKAMFLLSLFSLVLFLVVGIKCRPQIYQISTVSLSHPVQFLTIFNH